MPEVAEKSNLGVKASRKWNIKAVIGITVIVTLVISDLGAKRQYGTKTNHFGLRYMAEA